jgi:exosortase
LELSSSSHSKPLSAPSVVAAAAALLSLLWLYWPLLQGFARRWESDPQYSHGPMIPLVAIGIVWMRGIPKDSQQLHPTWWGLPLLITGLILKFVGGHFYFEWVESVSLIPAVAGVCLMLSGLRLFRSLWPAVVFLLFMMPLPYRVEFSVLQPLQNLATTASTFALQTLGFASRHEGNVVWIGTTPVGVAEACSGLRMLTGFCALAVAAAFVVDRERWKRICLLLSAIPVALICNIFRVTLMGVVHAVTDDSGIHSTLHDVLGWLMPVGAVTLLWGELWMMDCLFVVDDDSPEGQDLNATHPHPDGSTVPIIAHAS